MAEKEKDFLSGISDKVKDVLDGPDNVMGTEDDLLRRAKDKAEDIGSAIVAKTKDILDGADNVAGTADDPLEKVKKAAKDTFEKVQDMFDENKEK